MPTVDSQSQLYIRTPRIYSDSIIVRDRTLEIKRKVMKHRSLSATDVYQSTLLSAKLSILSIDSVDSGVGRSTSSQLSHSEDTAELAPLSPEFVVAPNSVESSSTQVSFLLAVTYRNVDCKCFVRTKHTLHPN